jgi:hypothetical protein
MPPPPVKHKALTKALKKAAKKAAAVSDKLSENALDSKSDTDIMAPPKKKKKVQSREPDVLHHDQQSAYPHKFMFF